MLIHLIRHAETIWQKSSKYAGTTDVPLSSDGLNRARMLARNPFFKTVDGIYSSTLSRARDTALLLSDELQIDFVEDNRIIEINYGFFEGKDITEIISSDKDLWFKFTDDPWNVSLPGGESAKEVFDRSIQFFKELLNSEKRNVLVVSHGTLIRILLCRLLDIPGYNYRKSLPELDPLSLSTIRVADQARRNDVLPHIQLLRFNCRFPGE
jgi:broad specificity phosphatase PhoE